MNLWFMSAIRAASRRAQGRPGAQPHALIWIALALLAALAGALALLAEFF